MGIGALSTGSVQQIGINRNTKAVDLQCNSYRFAWQRLSVRSVNRNDLHCKNYGFRTEMAKNRHKTAEHV